MPPHGENAGNEQAYQVGGSISEQTSIYVRRDADEELYRSLKEGELCYVFNSRQMGKSSMLVSVKSRLQDSGYCCSFVDLSRIGSVDVSVEQWFAGIVAELWRGFALPAGPAMLDWWRSLGEVSPAQKLSAFFQQLPDKFPGKDMAIFFDEVDSVLSLSFPANDFFSVVRAVYNQRADNPELRSLHFAFFGVAQPSDLIDNIKLSPFNIGRAIALEGFTLQEAAPLAEGLRACSDEPERLLESIILWTNGQPFLTQKLCQIVANSSSAPPADDTATWVDQLVQREIIGDWESKDNPEHLRTIRDRVVLDEEHSTLILADYARLLAADNECLAIDDLDDYNRLYLTGLVALEKGCLSPRTRIYRRIFDQQWIEGQLQATRPYAEKMRAWQDSGDDEWLLHGEELESAKRWAEHKHLPEEDHLFITASQSLESRAYQVWNERLQDEVSQRKRAEEELQQALKELEVAKAEAEAANTAKSEFLARVSHEVRTPINSVIGLSHLAQQQDIDPVSRDYLEKIARSGNYMLGVVSDIVDLGKVERGELTLVVETFCLDDVIDRLIDVFATRLYAAGLDFHLSYPDEPVPLLLGDANRLEQLLLNLITNAIKHTAQGYIELSVEFAQGTSATQQIQFTVRDTGEGLGGEPIEGKVSSEPDSVLTAGLGLRLCCGLASMMGSQLHVSSSPGEGCQFSLKVDLQIAAAPQDVAEVGQQLCLLGLEGHDSFRRQLRLGGYTLRQLEVTEDAPSCEVLVFDGLDEALHERLLAIRRAHPTIILLPLLRPSLAMPEHLKALGIRLKIEYPASPSRVSAAIQLAVAPESREYDGTRVVFDSGCRVLVAEDDEFNQVIISELLQQMGLQAQLVENGAEVLEALRQHNYDLVLMDIEMPVVGGLEAVQRLRSDEAAGTAGKDTPVVAMTAHALVGDRERFLDAGMNEYLTKPLRPDLLAAVLSKWLPRVDQADTPPEKPAILLVGEQRETIRELIDTLKPHYTVLVATSVARGLELLLSDRLPRAALMDIQVQDAEETPGYQAVSLQAKAAGVPLLLVCEPGDDDFYKEAIALGISDFIDRPVSPALLLARVRLALDQATQR